MAVFTKLSHADAQRVAEAHGLPPPVVIHPIAAGSVNSNFFLEDETGQRWFARIYEEQDVEGVRYEWALLDHLHRAGLPVPERVEGPAPGAIRVADKPVAIFEVVGGVESCQRGVSEARAAAVGRFLARTHEATDGFTIRRAGRFTLDHVLVRLDAIAAERRPELAKPERAIRAAVDEVQRRWPEALSQGVVHGDLFRDNVRWEKDTLVAAIDWESASDGARIYDLMVCVLSWCWGDTLEWPLARALVSGYHGARPLSAVERGGLRLAGLAAAARFSTTRITDYHLRAGGVGERVLKDYRRFVDRLGLLASMADEELEERLF